ncbi:MAG: ribonuclease P protein component [Bacteroidales bacterium]|jgi:ribonuclease P protein component|nr:ribonuclease P protein component [Bacteroidales bacterium]
MDNSLKRDSILRLKSEIQDLFDNGKREYPGIIKVVWIQEKDIEEGKVKIFISVPKKIINKAVRRNLVKRRIKEALRINLTELKDLCKQNNICIKLGVVYIHSSIEEFDQIENKIMLTLQKIYSKIYETL